VLIDFLNTRAQHQILINGSKTFLSSTDFLLKDLTNAHTTCRGADSVKLPRSMKIPTKAAALSLPMISLCFLTKLAL